MSTALAIASVTAVLKDLLNNGLIDHNLSSTLGNVAVIATPPDRVDTGVLNPQSQLNLFLYQVTPNAGWRNVALPSRDARGRRMSNPPLALDLHYLLIAYGAVDLHAEILLGYGMQLLHETPVLTRSAIRTALAPPSPVTPGGGLPPQLQALFTSELAEQIELIKIVPETLNTEEISRMWTAFQAHYRPTVAYHVSVVLIESKASARSPLPVRARRVYVVPFRQPFIEEIRSRAIATDPFLPTQPILAGHQIALRGRGLRGDDVRVAVGGIDVIPADAEVTDAQIALLLPSGLRAGIQGVQVIHRRLMGEPPTPHRGVESNVAAFVLRPRLEAIALANMSGSGTAPRSGEVTVTVTPPVGDTQRVMLLLNEFIPIASPPSGSPIEATETESYSFVAPSRIPLSPPSGGPGETGTITIPITRVKAGTYLVRVQVDGAESVLATDAIGQFVAPQVTIP
jgi:hypothetical protein